MTRKTTIARVLLLSKTGPPSVCCRSGIVISNLSTALSRYRDDGSHMQAAHRQQKARRPVGRRVPWQCREVLGYAATSAADGANNRNEQAGSDDRHDQLAEDATGRCTEDQ